MYQLLAGYIGVCFEFQIEARNEVLKEEFLFCRKPDGVSAEISEYSSGCSLLKCPKVSQDVAL